MFSANIVRGDLEGVSDLFDVVMGDNFGDFCKGESSLIHGEPPYCSGARLESALSVLL